MFRLFHRLPAALLLIPAILYGAVLPFATRSASGAETTGRVPHIALMLPLNSAAFGRHADAVRQGFFAAAKVEGKDAPPIRIYAVDENTVHLLTVYEQAIESGAQFVVGPLTRNGVAALAASNLVTVPTLALNLLEPRTSQPPRLYLFGLSIEQEARQVARLAREDGRRNAFVIGDDTPLSKRMQQSFNDEFAAAGGALIAEFGYGADAVTLNKLRHATASGTADMVFLALDSAKARIVRPYLANAVAIYATSQVNAGGNDLLAARDLDQVRFLDMPWLLQRDHPAVMIYPRAEFGDAIDFERLYALGIDAFRISIELLRSGRAAALDGVTGRLRLTPGQQFTRELTAAQFVDGRLVVRSEP